MSMNLQRHFSNGVLDLSYTYLDGQEPDQFSSQETEGYFGGLTGDNNDTNSYANIDEILNQIDALPEPVHTLNLTNSSLSRKLQLFAEVEKLSALSTIILANNHLGGEHFRPLKQFGQLTSLDAQRTGMTDASLGEVGELVGLRTINLSENRLITNQGLQCFKNLTDLRNLNLLATGIDSDGLRSLENHKKLEGLDLGLTKVDNTGLHWLSTLEQLSTLWMDYTHITDEGLEFLAALAGLTNLHMSRTAITSAGLKKWKLPSGITQLCVACENVDNEALPVLVEHHQILDTLELGTSQVTDSGLRHLAELHDLKNLGLSGTKVNGSGLGYLVGECAFEIINIGNSGVDNTTFDVVTEFPSLEELVCFELNITSYALTSINKLQKLRLLSLNGTQVSNYAVRLISELPCLETVDLGSTGVDDDSVPCFDAMSKQHLTTLILDDSSFTSWGLQKLLDTVPSLHIYASHLQERDFVEVEEPYCYNDGVLDVSERSDDFDDDDDDDDTMSRAIDEVDAPITGLDAHETEMDDDMFWWLADKPKLSDITALWLGHNHLTDKAMGCFTQFPLLKILGLQNNQITGATLWGLASLRLLEELDVGSNDIGSDDLQFVERLPNLHTLELYDTELGDDGIALLNGCTRLNRLDLSSTKVSAVGIWRLLGLPSLAELGLGSCALIIDAALEPLAKMQYLEKLWLDHLRFSSEALKQWKPVAPIQELYMEGVPGVDNDTLGEMVVNISTLTVFDLSKTAISDKGLPHLASLNRLTKVNLSDTRITGSGLEGLSDYCPLVNVNLAGTDANDDTMQVLSAFSKLEEIDLFGAVNVTDTGITHLANLPKLASLYIRGTSVTREGVLSLAAMPSLRTLSLNGGILSEQDLKDLKAFHPLLRVIPSDNSQPVQGEDTSEM